MAAKHSRRLALTQEAQQGGFDGWCGVFAGVRSLPQPTRPTNMVVRSKRRLVLTQEAQQGGFDGGVGICWGSFLTPAYKHGHTKQA